MCNKCDPRNKILKCPTNHQGSVLWNNTEHNWPGVNISKIDSINSEVTRVLALTMDKGLSENMAPNKIADSSFFHLWKKNPLVN